ncbi:MAG: ABC transporter permease, partial [Gammaproteobacteria bacterium]|nr:ABC transporter permease [Gammaproteobacteria bacterium]
MNTREKLIALKAIITKEILRFSRIWIQTVLPPVITTALYFVIFGNLIGPRIGEMDGFGYMEFIIPGLIMMAVITNSYANVVSSFYGSKFQRHIEEMLISPVPNYIILIGYISGGVARGLTVGVAVTIVSLLFHPLNIHSLWVMFSMIILTAILFSLAGLINGVYA